MSGGVDSSVTAALLMQQGYDVTGVYMKNWSQDLPGMACPWKQDYQDAKRVAVQLGIPFKLYDFEKQYREKVVEYMIDEYQAGRTPNPDIMCNQEVKFKLFLHAALADGADLIATGHYARIVRGASSSSSRPAGVSPKWSPRTIQRDYRLDGQFSARERSGGAGGAAALIGLNAETEHSLRSGVLSPHPSPSVLSAPGGPQGVPLQVRSGKHTELHAGVDVNKDQSYFLCRVTEDALQKSLMPIGEYTKPEVRELARKFGLYTAEKKDSQGICFVGNVGIKEFLQQFVTSRAGRIIDQHGKVLGEHDGALFYTIGQRQGLGIGGGLPYYVVGKNIDKNEVYVTNDLQDSRLWHDELTLTSPHWINEPPCAESPEGRYAVRTRYRAPLLGVKQIRQLENGNWHLVLAEEVRALTAGQSAVLYEDDRVVGSGIVI